MDITTNAAAVDLFRTPLRRVTLSDAQAELEQRGFTLLTTNESSTATLTAVKSECRWEYLSATDTIIFVTELPQTQLTAERTFADLDLIPETVVDLYSDPSMPQNNRCLPHGIGRTKLILYVYLCTNPEGPEVPQQPIPSDAIRSIQRPISIDKVASEMIMLAAQDCTGTYAYLGTNRRSSIGMLPEMEWWGGLMTGCAVPRQRPAHTGLKCMMFLILISSIIILVTSPTKFGIWMAFSFLFFAIHYGRQAHRVGRYRQKRRSHHEPPSPYVIMTAGEYAAAKGES
jgi:hypothetical protein